MPVQHSFLIVSLKCESAIVGALNQDKAFSVIVKLQSSRRFVSSSSGQVVGGYRGGPQLMLGRGRWGYVGGGTGPHPRLGPEHHGITCTHTCPHLDTPHTPALLARLGAVSLWLMTILGEHILIQIK